MHDIEAKGCLFVQDFTPDANAAECDMCSNQVWSYRDLGMLGMLDGTAARCWSPLGRLNTVMHLSLQMLTIYCSKGSTSRTSTRRILSRTGLCGRLRACEMKRDDIIAEDGQWHTRLVVGHQQERISSTTSKLLTFRW